MSRILIVDDRTESRRKLAGALVRMGHESFEARRGADAISQISKRRFDAVILELNMSHMDGWQVLTWVGARFTASRLPVIVHAASGETDDLSLARELGASACWKKKSPGFQEIYRSIESLIKRVRGVAA